MVGQCLPNFHAAGLQLFTVESLFSPPVIFYFRAYVWVYNINIQKTLYLPPHAKFHAKELLSRLLTQSESVKTICSSNPSMAMKIITDVHASIQEIVDLIRK